MNNSKGPTSASSAAASHQNTPQQNRMIRHMPSSVGVSSSSLTTNTTTSAQPTELSAAITFLGEEALLQACDILVSQSNAMFGGQEKDITEDTVKSENTSHVNKLTQLHEKVKTSHDIIIKADEAGTLNDAATSNTQQQGIIMRSDSGLSKTNPSPSMNHRNSLVNVSGVKAPPNLSRGNSSISNTNTTPSLHRSRSSSLTAHGGGGGNASGSKNQLLLLSGRRQKMPSSTTESNKVTCNLEGCKNTAQQGGRCIKHGGKYITKQERALDRLPSDTSDSGVGGDGGGGKGSGKKAQPPPEVLNFLKALNSKNSGSPATGDGSTTDGGNVVGERLASFAGVDMPSLSTANAAKKRPPPPPSHPPSSSKKGRPTTKRVARGVPLAPSFMSDKTPAKGSKKDRPSSSEKTPATKTPSDKTQASSSSGARSSGRSSRRSSAPSSSEKIYDIGADVNVLMDGKQYGGIVKNVDYGSDDSGSDKGAMYEVELSGKSAFVLLLV